MRLQYWRDLGAVEEQRREETRAGGSRNCFSHDSNFCVLQSESGGNLVSTFTFFLFSFMFCLVKMFQSLLKHHRRGSDSSESFGYSAIINIKFNSRGGWWIRERK